MRWANRKRCFVFQQKWCRGLLLRVVSIFECKIWRASEVGVCCMLQGKKYRIKKTSENKNVARLEIVWFFVWKVSLSKYAQYVVNRKWAKGEEKYLVGESGRLQVLLAKEEVKRFFFFCKFNILNQLNELEFLDLDWLNNKTSLLPLYGWLAEGMFGEYRLLASYTASLQIHWHPQKGISTIPYIPLMMKSLIRFLYFFSLHSSSEFSHFQVQRPEWKDRSRLRKNI